MKNSSNSIGLSKSQWRVISVILKLVFVILLTWVVYTDLSSREGLDSMVQLFWGEMQGMSVLLLAAAIMLMPLNWYLETRKWKTLLEGVSPISQLLALKGVLVGLVVGIITPGRVGEYGGRLVVLDQNQRWAGMSATFVSSILQNFMNIFFGLVGGLYFLSTYYYGEGNPSTGYFIASLISLMIIIAGAVIFRKKIWSHLSHLTANDRLKMIKKPLKQIASLKSEKLHHASLLSFIRYIVYSLQYVLFLHFFGLEIPMIAVVSGVSLLFLVQSAFPLPPILGIMARSEIALLVWSVFSDNLIGILASTLVLWIINLIIPALLGLILLLRTNLMAAMGVTK